jgi:opacity protein-like surface antigen
MRKLIWFTVIVLALSAFALAEDTSAPKVEVFGGYSLLHTGNGALISGDSTNFNGWNAAVTGYFTRYLGLTADISGGYNSNISSTGEDGHVYNFLFGPTVRLNNGGKLTPFAHALFGVSQVNGGITGNVKESDFAMAVGGGADYKLTSKFSVRLAQLDWLRTNYYNTSQNNMRLSTGVVFHF